MNSITLFHEADEMEVRLSFQPDLLNSLESHSERILELEFPTGLDLDEDFGLGQVKRDSKEERLARADRIREDLNLSLKKSKYLCVHFQE